MIRLTSKWTLKNGLTQKLMQNLNSASELIQTEESGTLMYLVHLDETHATKKEAAITFIEIYKSRLEYSQQNKGQVFANFREQNIEFFEEDPENPGWPAFESQVLKLDSGLIQSIHHGDINRSNKEAGFGL